MGDNNTKKTMTSNETSLTVEIDDLIISEGPSFNIYQKPRFKKVRLHRKHSRWKIINLNYSTDRL